MIPVDVIFDCPDFTVCVKPIGVNSQDCPGGMPELLCGTLGGQNRFYVMHRLDREVGGVMVYAKNPRAAAAITGQLTQEHRNDGGFDKRYLAVICGVSDSLTTASFAVNGALGNMGDTSFNCTPGMPASVEGVLRDLLYHDRVRNKTYVVDRQRAGVRLAELEYRCLAERAPDSVHPSGLCLMDVHLVTGRTHQIRVQFASRRVPLLGDAKYGGQRWPAIGLWAYRLGFCNIRDGKRREFYCMPTEEHAAFAMFRDEIQSKNKDDRDI